MQCSKKLDVTNIMKIARKNHFSTFKCSGQINVLEFQFCTICPKLFILKEFYFLILESNVIPHYKYLSK